MSRVRASLLESGMDLLSLVLDFACLLKADERAFRVGDGTWEIHRSLQTVDRGGRYEVVPRLDVPDLAVSFQRGKGTCLA